jgi:hypothetical protein
MNLGKQRQAGKPDLLYRIKASPMRSALIR